MIRQLLINPKPMLSGQRNIRRRFDYAASGEPAGDERGIGESGAVDSCVATAIVKPTKKWRCFGRALISPNESILRTRSGSDRQEHTRPDRGNVPGQDPGHDYRKRQTVCNVLPSTKERFRKDKFSADQTPVPPWWNSHITDSLPAAKNNFQTTHGLVQPHPSFGKPAHRPAGSHRSPTPAPGLRSVSCTLAPVPPPELRLNPSLSARTNATKENRRGSAGSYRQIGGRSERSKRFKEVWSKLVGTCFEDVGAMDKALCQLKIGLIKIATTESVEAFPINAISANYVNAQDMKRRVVVQLVSSLNGLSRIQGGDEVLVIGATNRHAWMSDLAMTDLPISSDKVALSTESSSTSPLHEDSCNDLVISPHSESRRSTYSVELKALPMGKPLTSRLS
ncbi:peroxisome assembly factor-2 [Culex quinquefasciatus]|uniref:Peroxisome assembly factor-2 n=1 Tax=Culex quinquefasciatus TaxID=7176 RepID=B0XF99_CULQU|nr:peroxisome assembly factor-2 [Culex quinquefasciatus]|eukprot:XP_001868321.1 peroxisome assembly factor-2 [Culex quinquefasciatus]